MTSKPLSKEEWAEFKRKYPTVAKLAEKLDEKGMTVIWNE